MNASGVSDARRASKRATNVRATPYARNSSSLARSVDSRGGAAAGAKNSRGCGSNVSTAGGNAQVLRGLDQPRQHRLVAAMHAVEVADRQRDRRLPCARQLALYTHSVSSRASSMRHPFNKTRHFSAVASVRRCAAAMLVSRRRPPASRRRQAGDRARCEPAAGPARGRSAHSGRAAADNASNSRRESVAALPPRWAPVLKSTM